MDPSAAVLTDAGMAYRPLATGYEHHRRFPTQGLPFTNGPYGGLAAMAVAAPMQRMMGDYGMVAMGVGHDQNVYDRIRNQQFTLMQMQAMQQAAQHDRQAYVQTFRGLAAVTGTPFGADQRRAAQSLANAAAMASPFLAEAMPDVLDQLGGARGSAAVMANRVLSAGRYRIDPTTGLMGMGAASAGGLATALHADLFGPSSASRMYGVTAGQAGSLFQELQMRGMVASGAAQAGFGGFRGDSPRAGVFRAVEDMQLSGGGSLSQAAGRVGVDLGRPGGLRPEDLDKLALDPGVADRLRGFDTNRVKRAIQSYAGVVAAMRDIFGDMGKPNAPMAELIAGIEALTMNGTAQMDPGRMSMMVRNTYNLAKQTGVPMANVMMMQQHAASRAAQLGLEPAFAVQATQGALAFGGAYRAQGHAAFGAWGAMSADQVQQLDANLRLQAASSNAANRLAVAGRLAETAGFAPDSEAARLTAAIRAGQTQYRGADGTLRSVVMGDRDFARIMTAGAANVSEGDVQALLAQRDTNREYVERLGLGDTVRRAQGPDELNPFVAGSLQTTLTSRLREQLVRGGATPAAAAERAQRAAAAVSRRVTDRIFDPAQMNTEQFADRTARNRGIGTFIEEELGAAGMGDLLAAMPAEQQAAFLAQTADQFYGAANRAIGTGPYAAFGNLQNVHRLNNRTTMDEADRQRMQARFTSEMQDALSPLGRGSVLQRAVEALQGMRPDDPRGAMGVVAAALGGVRIDDINRSIMPQVQAVADRQKAVEELQRQAVAAGDPQARAEILGRLDVARRQLGGEAGTLARVGEQFGLFSADTLTHADLSRALASTRGLMVGQNDIVGVRGNFGNEVTESQVTAFRAGLGAVDPRNPMSGPLTAEERAAGLDPNTPEGAAGLIRGRRRRLPYRASEEAVNELAAAYPQMTREEAADVANARVRAARLGVDEAEVTAFRNRPENRGRFEGPLGEVDAIAHLFAARAGQQFEASDADVAALASLPGYRGLTADDVRRFREEFGATGSDADVTRQMQRRFVVQAKRREAGERFGRFWGSAEGAAFREDTAAALDDVENVAGRLVSPQMVQRLGSRAVEISDALRGDQQRLRELALYHTGGDVARLMGGDYSQISDRSTVERVAGEVASIQSRQRAYLAELGSTEGLPGRRFQLGDEDGARRAVLGAEVAAGRMSQADMDRILNSGVTPARQLQVEAMRRQLGSESSVRTLLGLGAGPLSPADQARVDAARFGAGTDDAARGVLGPLTAQQPTETDAAFGRRREAYDRAVGDVRRGLFSPEVARERLGIGADQMPSNLAALVDREREWWGNEEEAFRLMGKRRGDRLTQDELAQHKQLAYDVGVARRVSPAQEAALTTFGERTARLATIAAARGTTVDNLGNLSDPTARQAVSEHRASLAQVEEIARSLGVGVSDLAGVASVTRRLREAHAGAAARGAASPVDTARSILREFGFRVGDTPSGFETQFGQMMATPAGRGMADRILSSQRELAAVAGARPGGPGGLAGIDAMSAEYFRAVRSGRPGDMEAFRRAFGMWEGGEAGERFDRFQRAIQFQQQTGLLAVGAERSGHRTRNTEQDLARVYATAVGGDGQMREVAPPDAGGRTITGTLNITGDRGDLSGSWGGGRAFGVPGGN